jgi:sigma54-dependent transcription regulator
MNQQFRRHRCPTTFVLTLTTLRSRQRATLIDVNHAGARLEGVENVMFGHVKTRHRGHAKNRAQLFTLFALGNLFLVRRELMA